jgi:predicted kinase
MAYIQSKKIYILCGVPGSGKSTWAREQINKLDGKGIIISRDVIRFSMLGDDDAYFAHEDAVFDEFIKKIQEAINDEEHTSIFIDATHLNEKNRNKVLSRIWRMGDDVVIGVYFDIPLEECLRRNALRTGRALVPETVIKNMYESLTKPLELDEMIVIGE